MQFGQAAHRRSEDREELEEDQADVDCCVAAGGRAAGDQPATASEGTERALERLAADVLEDDVDAALAGEAADLLGEVDFAVEDRLVGAELSRPCRLRL